MRFCHWFLVFFAFFFGILSGTTHAAEESVSPWYLSTTFGSSEVDDLDVSPGQDIKFDDGYLASLAGGFDGGFWRLELEGVVSGNDVDRLEASGFSVPASGDVSVAGLMFNGYLEWDNTTHFVPYIGLGIGWVQLAFNDIRSQSGLTLDDEDTSGASQFMMGVDYRLTNHLLAGIRLRGLGIYDMDFVNGTTGQTHSADYFNFASSLALRYYF